MIGGVQMSYIGKLPFSPPPSPWPTQYYSVSVKPYLMPTSNLTSPYIIYPFSEFLVLCGGIKWMAVKTPPPPYPSTTNIFRP